MGDVSSDSACGSTSVPPTSSDWTLRVMCGEQSANIVTSASAKVSQLRVQAGEAIRLPAGKTIKLIFAGRLLSDENARLDSIGLKSGAVLHAALVHKPEEPAAGMHTVAGGHSVLARATEPAAEADLHGFDRLRLLGLDSDGIAVLRGQFLDDVRRDHGSLPLLPGETEAHRLRRMEDAWLRAQGEDSDFVLNLRPLLLSRQMGAPWMGSAEGLRFLVAQQRSGGYPSPAAMQVQLGAYGHGNGYGHGYGLGNAGSAASAASGSSGSDVQGGDPAAAAADGRAGAQRAQFSRLFPFFGRQQASQAGGQSHPALHDDGGPVLPLAHPPQPQAAGAAPAGGVGAGEGGELGWRNGAAPAPGGNPAMEGSWGAFAGGVAAGWILGAFALLWAFMPNSTRKFKQGIYVGVALSFLLSVALPSDQSSGGSSSSSSGTGSGDDSGSGGAGGGIFSGGSAWTGGAGSSSGWQPLNVDSLGDRR